MPLLAPWRHVQLAALFLLAVFLLFEFTPIDLWVQARLYDTTAGSWLWARDEPVLRFLLYDGIKAVYALFMLGLLLVQVLYRRRHAVMRNRQGLLIVVLSLLLVPLTINALKAGTKVACPRALRAFGGSVPYVKLFESYPAAQRPDHRMRCYPAGHASGGFALLSLIYLAGTKRRRRQALVSGLAAGWISGLYKMVIGDHFLSHTIVSMLLAWLIINLVALLVLRDAPAPAALRSPA
jgi:membrane-associated PAP2 superfamily phosphatase